MAITYYILNRPESRRFIGKKVEEHFGWDSFRFVIKRFVPLDEHDLCEIIYARNIGDLSERIKIVGPWNFHTLEDVVELITRTLESHTVSYDDPFYEGIFYNESIRHQITYQIKVISDREHPDHKVVVAYDRHSKEEVGRQLLLRKQTSNRWSIVKRSNPTFRALLGESKPSTGNDKIIYKEDKATTTVSISPKERGVVLMPPVLSIGVSKTGMWKIQACDVDKENRTVELCYLDIFGKCSYRKWKIYVTEKGLSREVLDKEVPQWLSQLAKWGDISEMPYHNEEQKQYFAKVHGYDKDGKYKPLHSSEDVFKTWDGKVYVNPHRVGWLEIKPHIMDTYNFSKSIKEQLNKLL